MCGAKVLGNLFDGRRSQEALRDELVGERERSVLVRLDRRVLALVESVEPEVMLAEFIDLGFGEISPVSILLRKSHQVIGGGFRFHLAESIEEMTLGVDV